jgi:carbamoyltransferase
MRILGLNLGFMATASMFVDGEIVSSISQERFSRSKNDESYPKEAIDFVLAHAGVESGRDVDAVAIGSVMHDVWHRLAHYYSAFSIEDRIEEQHIYWKPVLYEGRQIAWHDLYANRLDYDQYPGNWRELASRLSGSYYLTEADQQAVNDHIVASIGAHTGIPHERFHFVDHHAAHAAYAYYASPFRDGRTLVLRRQQRIRVHRRERQVEPCPHDLAS